MKGKVAEVLRVRRELDFYSKHFYAAAFNPMGVQDKFLACNAKISVLSGGNRSGKTECGAVKAAMLSLGILGRRYPESGFPDDGRPTKGIISGLDYKVINRTLKPKFFRALGRGMAGWSEREQKATTKNGSQIWFMSEESGEQKYQAFDIDWAWKDEFGGDKSSGVVSEILRGLVDRNGPLFVTATPTLGASWAGPLWWEPWRDATDEKDGAIHACPRDGHCSANGVTFYFMNHEDNVYISSAAKKDWVARQTTDQQRAARLHGRFVTLEGLVYSMFDPRKHVIPARQLPKEWKRYRAMDFGLQAPSTCLWGAVEPAGKTHGKRLHIYRELYDTRQGKTIKTTCETIKEGSVDETYVQTVLDPSCWKRDPAPAAVGGYFIVADEYGRHGVYAERANNEVEASVERLWGYFGLAGEETQILIHDNCPKLIWEIRRQKWKSGITSLTQTSGITLGDKINPTSPDHAIDALRYMVMAGPLEEGDFYGPDSDPYDPGEHAGSMYGDWQLVDGEPVLVMRRQQ